MVEAADNKDIPWVAVGKSMTDWSDIAFYIGFVVFGLLVYATWLNFVAPKS